MNRTVAPRGEFANTVIRASAGTGKTFQLSSRFLALVASGARPDHILAVTFARKAAGEIRDRIFVRLAQAVESTQDRELLASSLGVESLSPQRCRQLLRNLVRHLHRLKISTLDSFFTALLESYRLELGLPPGAGIVEEQADALIRQQAIRDVIGQQTTTELVTLMHLLAKGEVRRSVTVQISEVVDDLYPLFREAPVEAWEALTPRKQLGSEELEQAIGRLEALTGLPNNRFVTARNDHVQQCRSGDWKTLLSKGLTGKLASGDSAYYRVEIPAEVAEACAPLIDHATAVLISRVVDQTLSTRRLLELYDRALQTLRYQQRALRFDDVTSLVAAGFRNRLLEDVSFRLDAGVEHLLLDEFQDTSLAQWDAVRHFAETTAAGDSHSFFCVGDVKQAIYGWRGGVAELFETVTETLPDITTMNLDSSYRSRQPVMEIVNRVFEAPAANDVLAAFPQAAMTWQERFNPHRTERAELSGFCRLTTAPRADATSQQRGLTLDYAAQQAARWHRAYPEHSVGILVRRNETVGRLISLLQQRYQVRASEEGGNPLTDSVAVLHVLELLRLADHPGNTASRYCVAHSPLGEAIGYQDYTDDRTARQLSLQLRRDLTNRGYAAVLYEWAEHLAPACDERELRRLLQLCRLATDYEVSATERPADFVAYVEQTKVEDPASARVRVMTVHQSKGLEFDIVLLPELEGQLAGRTPSVLIERPDPAEPISGITRYIDRSLLQLVPPRFRRMKEEQESRRVSEALCVLYVAMTRAVHVLDLIIPPATATERTIPRTAAGVLRCSLADSQAAEPLTELFHCGDASWREQMEAVDLDDWREPSADVSPPDGVKAALAEPEPARRNEAGEENHSASTVAVAQLEGARAVRGLKRAAPSALEGGARIRLADVLQLEPSAATTRGSIHHRWYECVTWLDETVPTDAELQAVSADDLRHSELNPADELAAFRRTLDHPAVSALLTRDLYLDSGLAVFEDSLRQKLRDAGTTVSVAAEKRFAVRLENDLLEGSIDRLVLFRQNDQVVAADVIDFKTDRVRPDDAESYAERVEYYRPQIDAYRRAVSRMYHLPLTAVAGRLLFAAAGSCEQWNSPVVVE